MKRSFLLVAIISCLVSVKVTMAQDFMLQGWYWDYPKTGQGAFWVDTMRTRAKEWGQAGFNLVWCPPMSMAAAGNNSNGYDIKDLFNVGGGGFSSNTGFGNKAKIQAMMSAFNQYNIKAVGDMIYNHRDGGSIEDNPAVGSWIKNYTLAKHNNGDVCFPSDRFRCSITIGGNTGRGAGTYYFRVRSASLSSDYYNKPYKFYVRSIRVGSNSSGAMTESTNNGGGLCGQGNDSIALGRIVNATIDNGGCGIDEFKLVLDTSKFYVAGDKLSITLVNDNANYSDHYIYSLYYDATASELKDSVVYQTNTNFNNMQSGRGQMNYTCFKPNGNPTCLCGDWDGLLFFNDYDQSVQQTKDTLFAWTKWMHDSIGISGIRADAVKNFSNQFTSELLNYMDAQAIIPPVFVGEYYDYNPFALKGWVDNVKSGMTPSAQQSIQPRLFDFALQGSLKEACDNTGGFDVRNIFQNGMVDGAGASGFDVVSFVNNHDFRNASQSCDVDPILAYSYILTNNAVGLPCVYYPDYYLNNGSYKTKIDELIDLHKKFIFNTSFREYLNRFGTPFSSSYIQSSADKCLIYQLSGGGNASCLPNKDVIVAINFGSTTLKVDQQINTNSPFHSSIGDTLRDILGNSNFPYALVNNTGKIYIELPPRSYSVWVNVPQPAAATITLSGNTASFCKGDSVQLNAGGNACYTYSWRKNGVPIAEETKNTLVVKESGTYTVVVSYYGNFNAVSAPVIINVSPVQPLISITGNTLTSSAAAQYQWFYSPDNITYSSIPGANAQTYFTSAAGWYYVAITDANGCSDNSAPLNVTFAGIEQVNPDFNFNITPNPATSSITLNINALQLNNFSVQLIDAKGQTVVRKEYKNNGTTSFITQVDLNTLQSGLYFVKVEDDNYMSVKKFVKE